MRRFLGLAVAALVAAGCGNTPQPPAGNDSSTSGGTTEGTSAAAGAASSTGGAARTIASSTSSSSGSTGSSSGATSGSSGAGACAGLVPAAPGAPIWYSIAPAQGQGCGDYDRSFDSDGSGIVYLLYSNGSDSLDVVSPQGAHIATVQSGNGSHLYWLDAQLSGALGTGQGIDGGALWHVASDGSAAVVAWPWRLDPPLLDSSGLAANDPTGGMVIWSYWDNQSDHTSSSTLQAYDANGALRWSTPVAQYWLAMGVDRLGNTLLLGGNASGITGRWVDHAGIAGPEFTVVNADELSALEKQFDRVTFALVPRVGGGLFLRASDDVAAYGNEIPKWIHSIDSLSTAVAAAPAWLVSRPATDVQLIHHGSAYAVTSLQVVLDDCARQDVEVIAADGTSCGRVSLPLGGGSCSVEPLKIGYDGTLFQKLPRSMETCAATYVCSCTWRWWPAYFR